MTAALLLCALLLVVAGAWVAHRRHVALAWDRELEAAFGSFESREMPRHRLL